MNTVPRFTVFAFGMALLVACVSAFGADTPPGTDPAAAPAVAPPAADAAAAVPEPVEAVPVPAPPAPAPAAEKAPESPATPDQLQTEVGALRNDMRMLQSTLDLMVNKIMADLREENEQLRDEVRRLNALRGAQGLADINSVPRPAGSAVDQALSELPAKPAPPPPPPFKFTVVREWGRSAADAQKLGGEAQSLKGLIGVVPAGSLRKDVEKLARDLRGKYDEYDNINIEVFDDPLVANQFAANQAADPEHRVLSVSRHKASNRDAIVLLTNGKGEMISADPNDPLPPQQPDDLPTLSVTNPVAPGQSKRSPAANAESPNAAAAPGEAPAPGQWQKSEKKAHVKGSSKKKKEEPVLPESQRPIPEGVPVLVPHGEVEAPPQGPTQPAVTVIEAPPGVPVTQEPDPADSATVIPEKGADTVGQDNSGKAPRNPKNPFGPKSKKKK